MNEKEFVRNFMKIRVTNICKKLGITVSNISEGRASKEKFRQVKDEIEKEFHSLYVKKGD